MRKVVNQETSKTNEAPFRVTDRGLERYEELAHFDHATLPRNASILNVGGGESQQFEKELTVKRPDIEVTTIDPSIHDKIYRDGDTFLIDAIAGSRISELANKNRTISALGQALPLPGGSFDLILDVHGPSQYSSNEENYIQFLKEALRVLKVGGKLHIYNTFMGDIIPGDPDSESEVLNEQKALLEKIGVEGEIYLQEAGKVEVDGQEVSDNRVGIIITK